MIKKRYTAWVNAALIALKPMSAPPPSPQNAMTLIGSSASLPLRMSTFSPAAAAQAADPAHPYRPRPGRLGDGAHPQRPFAALASAMTRNEILGIRDLLDRFDRAEVY